MGDEVYNVRCGMVDAAGNYGEVDFRFHVQNVSGDNPLVEAKQVSDYFTGTIMNPSLLPAENPVLVPFK